MFKNRMKWVAVGVAVLMAVALVSAPALAEKKTLKFGVVAWSEALAEGALIEYLMEKELGQDVEIINPDAGVAYTALMNKELDLYIESWLPLTHETYWDKVASSVCDFGPMYEDASLGWAVPNYIPKDVVSSVEDLDKEEVKEKCPEVKFVGHYALLGDYDFVDIYEAPGEETAAKVSMISMDKGAFQAKSMLAIPYKRLVELSNEL